MFIGFSQLFDVKIDPADVVLLDPTSSHPAPPDIECRLPGGSHFFELTEVVQENIAEASSLKEDRVIVNVGEPVARIWETFWKAFNKKLKKTYNQNARPRSLLLYYDQCDSFSTFLLPIINKRLIEIRGALLAADTFDQIFLFDARKGEILLALPNSPSIIAR